MLFENKCMKYKYVVNMQVNYTWRTNYFVLMSDISFSIFQRGGFWTVIWNERCWTLLITNFSSTLDSMKRDFNDPPAMSFSLFNIAQCAIALLAEIPDACSGVSSVGIFHSDRNRVMSQPILIPILTSIILLNLFMSTFCFMPI